MEEKTYIFFFFLKMGEPNVIRHISLGEKRGRWGGRRGGVLVSALTTRSNCIRDNTFQKLRKVYHNVRVFFFFYNPLEYCFIALWQ